VELLLGLEKATNFWDTHGGFKGGFFVTLDWGSPWVIFFVGDLLNTGVETGFKRGLKW